MEFQTKLLIEIILGILVLVTILLIAGPYIKSNLLDFFKNLAGGVS